MTIIARCDKCAKTGCGVRDCLRVYAYVQMALAIMPTSHAEVINQKSLLRDNDRAVFRAKLVTIYVDWIALLCRLLMTVNICTTLYNTGNKLHISIHWNTYFEKHKRTKRKFTIPVDPTWRSMLCYLSHWRLPNTQAQSRGDAGGERHAPKICQQVHFWPQNGQEMGWLSEIKGDEVQKSNFQSESPHFGGLHPQNRSWLQACKCSTKVFTMCSDWLNTFTDAVQLHWICEHCQIRKFWFCVTHICCKLLNKSELQIEKSYHKAEMQQRN